VMDGSSKARSQPLWSCWIVANRSLTEQNKKDEKTYQNSK
jgi:hypothetical protein